MRKGVPVTHGDSDESSSPPDESIAPPDESIAPPDEGGREPDDAALAESPLVHAYFGAAFGQVSAYALMLADEGVRRGLIGPGEVARLWRRHILNSAAIAAHLPDRGTVIDVGTGAGLPGVVLAAMRPDLRTILLEPMERRVLWLREVIAEVGLHSAEVVRGRAEELHGEVVADAVTARAVAPMTRLVPWTLPLLRDGGVLLAMKGSRAAAEVADAQGVIRRSGGGQVEVFTVGSVEGVEPTTIVRVVRERAPVRAASPRRH